MEDATESFFAARSLYQEEFPVRAAQRGSGNEEVDFDMGPADLYSDFDLHEEEIHGIPPELAQERAEVRESVAKATEAREHIKRAHEKTKAFTEKVKRLKVDQSQDSNGIHLPFGAPSDAADYRLGAEAAAA